MAGSRSLSEVCFKASCLPGPCADQHCLLCSMQGFPAFLLVGLETWPSRLVFPLHQEENMTQERLCPLSYPWRTHSVLNTFQHLRKKDMVIKSTSLTAKMLDMKQIGVVLTKPFQSALLSILYALEKRTVGLRSHFVILISKLKFSVLIFSVICFKK